MAKSEISVWMPFYIDRFLSSLYVQSMTAEQRWWYVSILLRAWQADPPCLIPNDPNSLRMFAGCIDLDAWAFRSAPVVARFSPVEDGKYVANAPQLVIYQQQLASLEKAKEKAAYAAEKRWEKERAKKDAQTMLEQCSSNAQASKIGDKTMLEHEPSMTQALLGDAIQKEIKKEKENKALPPVSPNGGLVRAYAKGVLDKIEMPYMEKADDRNTCIVEAAIRAKMKTGMTDEKAADYLVEKAMLYKATGNQPAYFWWEAGGYDKDYSPKVKAKPEVPLYITERHKLEALGVKIEQGVPPSKYRDMLKAKGASNGNS